MTPRQPHAWPSYISYIVQYEYYCDVSLILFTVDCSTQHTTTQIQPTYRWLRGHQPLLAHRPYQLLQPTGNGRHHPRAGVGVGHGRLGMGVPPCASYHGLWVQLSGWRRVCVQSRDQAVRGSALGYGRALGRLLSQLYVGSWRYRLMGWGNWSIAREACYSVGASQALKGDCVFLLLFWLKGVVCNLCLACCLLIR